MALTVSADPDQTASEEAVRSGYSLFAILTSILLSPNPFYTIILFTNRKRKVFVKTFTVYNKTKTMYHMHTRLPFDLSP